MTMNSFIEGNMSSNVSPFQGTISMTKNNSLFDAAAFPDNPKTEPAIDHSRDAEFAAQWKADPICSQSMSQEQFVSLRRAECGLEPFIPAAK